MSFVQDIFEIKDRVNKKLNEPKLDLSFEGEEDKISIESKKEVGMGFGSIDMLNSSRETEDKLKRTRNIIMSVNLIVSNLGGSPAHECGSKLKIKYDENQSDRYKLGWLPINKRGEEIKTVFNSVDIKPSDYRQIELFRFIKTTDLNNEDDVRRTEIEMPSTSKKIKIQEERDYRFHIKVLSRKAFSDSLKFDFKWNGNATEEDIRSAINFIDE